MKKLIAISVIMAAACPVLQAQSSNTQAAMKHLRGSLGDKRSINMVLTVLRATGDKHLLPLFTAVSRSADKKRRLFAVSALPEIGDKASAPVLLERLRKDPLMAVRSEALIRLLDLKAISDEQLIEVLKTSDDGIQCIAARELVRRGRGMEAEKTLRTLTFVTDLSTACMARVSLLSLGYNEQLDELKKTFADPNTPQEVKALVLYQIAEDKVVLGMDLVRMMTRSKSSRLRLAAYRAIKEISPRASAELADAIGKSTRTGIRVRLLKLLADRSDSSLFLVQISKGKDVIADLARFELLRIKGGDRAAGAVAQVVKSGHPIVIDYVLSRANEDIKKRPDKSAYYAISLAEYIRSVEPFPKAMGADHQRAAVAATLLGDLGTPEALGLLRKILSGRYNGVTRATAAGLLRSTNRAVCDIAAPLLRNPYREIAMDAAFTMGRFADRRAAPMLRTTLDHPQRYSSAVTALCAWYLLKIEKATQKAGQDLAKVIR